MGQKIRLMSTGGVYEVEGLGYQSPKPIPCEELSAGEAGFVFANIKTVSDAKIGDTIMDAKIPATEPLPASRKSSRWCSPDSIRWNPTNMDCFAMRWRNFV